MASICRRKRSRRIRTFLHQHTSEVFKGPVREEGTPHDSKKREADWQTKIWGKQTKKKRFAGSPVCAITWQSQTERKVTSETQGRFLYEF